MIFLFACSFFSVTIATCELGASECLRVAFARSLHAQQQLVWVCDRKSWCGGIGDRLRGISTTFFMSIVLDRQFKIWTDPLPLYDIFDAPKCDWILLKEPACDHVLLEMDYGRGTRLMDLLAANFSHHSTLCVRTNHFFDGEIVRHYPQIFGSIDEDLAEPHFVYFGEAFRFLFRPTQLTNLLMEQLRWSAGIMSPISFGKKTSDWVAVHFRQGIGTDPERDGAAVIRNVSACFTQLQHALHWDGLVYVASDTLSAKAELATLIFNGVYSNVSIQHIDNGADKAGHVHAWAEFLLLAHASCIVASESGYSYWASAVTMGFNRTRCFAQWRKCAADIQLPIIDTLRFKHNANYSLFVTPSYEINVRLGRSGPELRYMTHMAVLYQGTSFIMDAWTVKNREVEMVRHFQGIGAKIEIDGWAIQLEICGDKLRFTSMHSTDQTNINFLGFDARVNVCQETYDGVLGRMYQCKYVIQKFQLTRDIVDEYVVGTLETPTRQFSTACRQ